MIECERSRLRKSNRKLAFICFCFCLWWVDNVSGTNYVGSVYNMIQCWRRRRDTHNMEEPARISFNLTRRVFFFSNFRLMLNRLWPNDFSVLIYLALIYYNDDRFLLSIQNNCFLLKISRKKTTLNGNCLHCFMCSLEFDCI